MAAMHTTSEALTQAVLDCCRHPEVVQPLREKVIRVIGEEGWSKTGLYKLRLMDSVSAPTFKTHHGLSKTSA
jgi:hypothetical protein